MCQPIVLCVYGMINDTKRWHDKENHPTRRGLIQGRHVSESIQESPECIFEPSRYAYRLATYSGTALCLLGSDTPAHRSFPEIQRMNFHERILWSPMRGYYGLIREDTMVSYERILWSHMRGYYGLL